MNRTCVGFTIFVLTAIAVFISALPQVRDPKGIPKTGQMTATVFVANKLLDVEYYWNRNIYSTRSFLSVTKTLFSQDVLERRILDALGTESQSP